MPVYLLHGNVWLRIKEVYTIQSQTQSRRRKGRKTAPYSMVAVAEKKPRINGLVKIYEVVVPSTKVSKFITRFHLAAGDFVALVKPYGQDYLVEIYGRRVSERRKAEAVVNTIFRDLRLQREEEEEDVLDVEEEEG